MRLKNLIEISKWTKNKTVLKTQFVNKTKNMQNAVFIF